MKLIMENWKRFLKESVMSGNGPLAEPAYRDDENDEVVEYIINATRAGQSPDEITQGLIEAGLTKEQALAALADAFDRELPGEEVDLD